MAQFRDYSVNVEDPHKELVRRTYRFMHTRQTVDFVKGKHREWLGFSHRRMTTRKALELLGDVTDESDPDVTVPNIVHAFQTAERIRRERPDLEWLQLTGLVHDVGKVLLAHGEPQWAVVGDTFIVGCEWPASAPYGLDSFAENTDTAEPRYRGECGMYEPGCGLDACLLSWGHDEYLYRVLVHNDCPLPEEALHIVRYHSLYPWHTGDEYSALANDKDRRMLPWLRLFNRYDLYTKAEAEPDIAALWPYYQGLIDKYMPGELSW